MAVVALILALAPAALAATKYKYRILYNFTGGTDGGAPASSLTFDAAGNLFGTTYSGGTTTNCVFYQGGCGVVFELSPQRNGQWKERVLFDFVTDTGTPPREDQPPLPDGAGNLFGSTVNVGGGAYVFELTPGTPYWNFNPIYDRGGICLVLSRGGDLFGCIPPDGIGELAPGSDGWVYTDVSDQTTSALPLTWDALGNLYGTGDDNQYCNLYGTAFQLTPPPPNGDGTWTYHLMHCFGSRKNDGLGTSGLVLDAAGDAYGATVEGGTDNCGIAYKLEPSGGRWKEKVLYNFHGYTGCGPLYPLALDGAGTLYGMAQSGDPKCGPCGVIFKLAPQKSGKWKYSVLHTFHGPEGADPYGVILDSKGNIFGSTYDGGKYGWGVVFEITP
jgi:hypothetical protein